MSATLHWMESNLVGEVETPDISNINFGNVDEPNIVPADDPVIIGQNSFSKYIRIFFDGTWTLISNMKFWKNSGAYVEGEAIKAAANVEYATPSKDATGDDNIPTEEGSALEIESAEGEVTIEYGVSGVSGYTKYIRLQTQTTVETPSGAGNQKEYTFQWDES